ncbi:MAG TPA: hypothetical protein DCP92_13115, partial [Nitrospiraceae bacterium]|nr:hypothetical protein [Nitrospiraceae bacterium]
VIGIDFNADHLAVTETDRFGNPVEYFTVPCVTYGKTAEQRRAIIGEAVKVVIAFAVEKGKPIVIEKLDFRRKKAALEGQKPTVCPHAVSSGIHTNTDDNQGKSV